CALLERVPLRGERVDDVLGVARLAGERGAEPLRLGIDVVEQPVLDVVGERPDQHDRAVILDGEHQGTAQNSTRAISRTLPLPSGSRARLSALTKPELMSRACTRMISSAMPSIGPCRSPL